MTDEEKTRSLSCVDRRRIKDGEERRKKVVRGTHPTKSKNI
jgi:hypothetical protein